MATFASVSLLLGLTAQAQSTTPNVKVEILGIGASSLLGGPLTDPDGNGLDEIGGATDPSWDWAGITSSHEPDFQGGENSFNIFDHKVGGGNDKWCCDDPTPGNPVWVAVQFRQPVSLTHFTIASGNDTPTRDPTDWAIQGSNNGTSYTDIYRFVDTTVPWDARNQVVKFTLPFASQAYTYIRYIAYDTPGTLHQINEIEYFGRVGGVEAAPTVYWEAFNDHRPTDGVTSPNASTFDMRAQDNGGVLRNIKDGQDLRVSVKVRVEGDGVPDDFGANTQPDAGSPADKLFSGKVDVGNSGIPGVRNSVNTRLILVFSGLNPGRRYNFAGTATRGNNYNDRWTVFTLSGAIASVDAHVDGSLNQNIFTKSTFPAGSLAPNQVALNSGDNKAGSLVAWNSINPGDDGSIEIAAAQYIGPAPFGDPAAGPYGYGFTAIYLAEIGLSSALDADGDGIPDAAEKLYGFNPNDPADAAQDFDKDGVSNLDEYKAGTDPVDVTKPTVALIVGSPTFNRVTITFSEEVDPATAALASNYSISPALAVTAATYSRRVVSLTTANQTPGATAYTVTVKGVRDMSKNEVAANTTALFYSYMTTRTGVLRFAYWTGITGTPVDNLLNDPNYPATPTGVGAIFSFNSRDFFPTDSLENYGAVIEGFVTPTESASYDFFLRSDDASQLFLSSDDKEANLAMIAEETGCCGAFMEPSTGDGATTAAPIALVAGRKYFIRVIYKEGGGGDFAQVAWRKTTDKTPAGSLLPIPGQFLSAAVDLPAPAEGAFTIQSPGPNARNFKPANPVTIAHRDGKTEWSAANVTLKFDGVDVKPTFTKTGNLATIEYKPSTLLASKSTHTVSLGYLDPGGKPATLNWSFETAEYKGPVKDLVKGYEALILGSAALTADKGGFSGKAGDYAVDFGRGSGQSVLVSDASFLNAATAADQLTFALWIKKYDTANNSAFWADSPSSSGGMRGFQSHTPWSDNNVYFDTAGCCDGGTQRISAGIDTFAGFTGDVSWWTNSWHHFAFTKNASSKKIWIDGTLFHEGDNTNPLPTDFARIWIGAEGGGPNAGTANNFHGLQDDFAIFGTALAEADVKKLAAGGSPSTLGAATKLVAYWDFNSLPVAAAKFTKIARNADGTITLEWTGGGTLEAATSVTGPWQAVTGATSPYKFT
ncbi:MAG: discoidin domain-containing protein, partial [Verrucomicrobia bacterium]|nr:discoidin domain-containing protein [Verrucomicrobiota bacterium]